MQTHYYFIKEDGHYLDLYLYIFGESAVYLKAESYEKRKGKLISKINSEATSVEIGKNGLAFTKGMGFTEVSDEEYETKKAEFLKNQQP